MLPVSRVFAIGELYIRGLRPKVSVRDARTGFKKNPTTLLISAKLVIILACAVKSPAKCCIHISVVGVIVRFMPNVEIADDTSIHLDALSHSAGLRALLTMLFVRHIPTGLGGGSTTGVAKDAHERPAIVASNFAWCTTR
jgi:hypothetical protein